MPFFDTDILISNIIRLMEESHTTQAKLAEYLSMSQPAVSKALSKNDKKCFTLDQIAGIAKYFSVSVDWLLGSGDSAAVKKTPRSVARFIIDMIEQGDLMVIDYQKEEEVYDVEFCGDGYACDHSVKRISYDAFHLPSYWHMPPSGTLSQLDEQALFAEMEQCGNQYKYFETNRVIHDFLQIRAIYLQHGLEEETYRRVVDDLINHLSDF